MKIGFQKAFFSASLLSLSWPLLQWFSDPTACRLLTLSNTILKIALAAFLCKLTNDGVNLHGKLKLCLCCERC